MTLVIASEGGSPHYNLAFEEALLHYASLRRRPAARLWINPPSIVIGYTLSACEEVKCEAARKNLVPIVRRVSGGGAVYHDYGNVNISLALPARMGVREAYRLITGLIISILKDLGLDARVENFNDVAVGPWKVSGTSAAIRSNATLVHGTLLVNTDHRVIHKYVIPRLDRVERGEVSRVKYNPRSISDILGTNLDPLEVIKPIASNVRSALGVGGLTLEETPREVSSLAMKLCIEKYSSDPRWSPLDKGTCLEPRPIYPL